MVLVAIEPGKPSQNEQQGEYQELASLFELDEAREPRERSELIGIENQPWETSLKRGGKEEKENTHFVTAAHCSSDNPFTRSFHWEVDKPF